MLPPPVSVTGLSFDCTAEELFNSLEKMEGGYPVPENVIVDVNPYEYAPSNLPEGIWFLVRSKENGATKFGYWKVKGEACKLFSNDMITGWRTTLEFFEGQAPSEHKTDWVMQQYWIIDKGLGENSKIKEARSLCRVFLGGKQGLGYEKQLKIGNPHIARDTLVAESVLPQANSGTSSGSTSKHLEDKDDEAGVLAVTGNPQHPLDVNGAEPEAYFSDGDFLELLDLEEPASPSSSSDNSSCLTMSSDELDFGSNRENENWHFNISASSMPNKVVTAPASPGSFSKHKECNASAEAILGVGTVSPIPALVGTSRGLDNVVRNRKASYRDEGLSSSHNAGTSSSHNNLSEDEEKKVARDRKKKQKKNKYMCFMPFYFLF